MPRKSEVPLEKHVIRLYAGDFEAIRELFPNDDASVVIRNIVRKTINNIKDRAAQNQEPIHVRFPE